MATLAATILQANNRLSYTRAPALASATGPFRPWTSAGSRVWQNWLTLEQLFMPSGVT